MTSSSRFGTLCAPNHLNPFPYRWMLPEIKGEHYNIWLPNRGTLGNYSVELNGQKALTCHVFFVARKNQGTFFSPVRISCGKRSHPRIPSASSVRALTECNQGIFPTRMVRRHGMGFQGGARDRQITVQTCTVVTKLNQPDICHHPSCPVARLIF